VTVVRHRDIAKMLCRDHRLVCHEDQRSVTGTMKYFFYNSQFNQMNTFYFFSSFLSFFFSFSREV